MLLDREKEIKAEIERIKDKISYASNIAKHERQQWESRGKNRESSYFWFMAVGASLLFIGQNIVAVSALLIATT